MHLFGWRTLADRVLRSPCLGTAAGRSSAAAEKRTALKVWEAWKAAWRIAAKTPPPELHGHGGTGGRARIWAGGRMGWWEGGRAGGRESGWAGGLALQRLMFRCRWHAWFARVPTAPALPKTIYGRDACELILVQLVLDGVLREDFGHTMYTTVSYLFVGHR